MKYPFAVLNSLPHDQVVELTAGCDQRGLRLVRSARRREAAGQSLELVHGKRDALRDFGEQPGAYDWPANQRSRANFYSRLPRHHTGIVLLDRQIEEATGWKRGRRINIGLAIVVALGITCLTAVLR